MSQYDFDTVVNRRNTACCKWDFMPESARNAIPMSLADMDIPAPVQVQEALARRVAHGIYGYTLMTAADLDAVRQWLLQRHGQDVPADWLLPTPGVVVTLRAAVAVMNRPGDSVVIQPPVHTPFFVTASRFGRKLVRNPLRRRADGRYEMDLDHLEHCFRADARLLILCSPHNPTGRVWTRNELETLATLCRRYDARVISDEIHRDILRPGARHLSLAMLPGMAERVVAVFSPTKTFNLGGFHIATAVIADPALRRALRRRLSDIGHACGRPTLFSIVAQTAAYRHGGPWLDAWLAYLDRNFTLALETLEGLPLHARRPDGTYMLWVDCRALKMNAAELMDFFVHQAGILPEPGHIYESADYQSYRGPEHFVRLNLGMPRPLLEQAMNQLRRALLKLQSHPDR